MRHHPRSRVTADTLVADIAAHHPRSIEVFEHHGIDFCSGGRRALGEACILSDFRSGRQDVAETLSALVALRPGSANRTRPGGEPGA